MNDGGASLIGAEDIAAGVTTVIELTLRMVDGLGGSRTAEQVPRQQPAATGLCRQFGFGSVGHGDENAALINPEPCSVRHGVNPGDGRERSSQNLGRFPAPAVDFLTVGTGYDRRVFHDPKKQR
jgi:hypothetical protein